MTSRSEELGLAADQEEEKREEGERTREEKREEREVREEEETGESGGGGSGGGGGRGGRSGKEGCVARNCATLRGLSQRSSTMRFVGVAGQEKRWQTVSSSTLH